MKGVEVIPGEGKLTAQDTITVGGVEYKGKNIILASPEHKSGRKYLSNAESKYHSCR